MVGSGTDGGSPPVERVEGRRDIAGALDRLRLTRARPVLVLVGGAGGMDHGDTETVAEVLGHAVLPVIDELRAAVVDGGTDSGVMRAIGRAHAAAGAGFPLIGVAAAGTVTLSGALTPAVTPIDGAAELEPHHTHVVLVPGRSWGAESPWMARVADVIATAHPSATLLVNGGEIAYQDVRHSLRRARPVIVLAGTGRTADAIASARHVADPDPRAARIAASKLTTIIPVRDVEAVRAAVLAALTTPTGAAE